MKPPRDASKEDRLELHREKMRLKAHRRPDTELTRQLARGRKIRGNFSNHPKGVKRTRPPRNSIWPESREARP